MSRFSVLWFILVIASGMTNFLVKQNVQGLDDQLNAVRKKTVAEQKAIHELTADWTFLNQPELLADLNNRYLHLTAVSPKQIVTNLDSIPMRPAPPPAPEAAPQIAAATPQALPVSAPGPAFASTPAPALAQVDDTTPIPLEPPTPSRPPPVIAAATPALAPAPTATAVHAQALPLSVISTAHAATEPAAPAAAPRPAKPASLDAIFAQVTGNR